MYNNHRGSTMRKAAHLYSTLVRSSPRGRWSLLSQQGPQRPLVDDSSKPKRSQTSLGYTFEM